MNKIQAQQFESFVQFIAAVISAEANDRADPRLVYQAAATGLNETGGAAGGFLVPSQFAEQLWLRVYATGRILARCDRQPVTRGDRVVIPMVAEKDRSDGEQPAGSRFGGAQMYWTDEAGVDNDSFIRFELLTLHLKKLLGMFFATDDLIEDVPALVAALRRIFGLEASFSIENAIVAGDGVGKPLGVLSSDALITVEKESGQAAGTIMYQNLVRMIERLWGPSHNSAMWLMSNEVLGIVLDLAADSDKNLITIDGDGTRRLLTYPIEVCEYTPALSSAGDILLGDFSQYIVAQKDENPDFLSSIHLKFSTDENAFKLRYRVDGAPGWKTPITPKNSTLTVSPFVALGAR
ncbi:phage major capsid protein [Bradyrhizobium cenepequi]